MRQSYFRNAPSLRHFLFIGVVIAAVTPKATADTLNAGDILEIRFSTTAPVCQLGPCDALVLYDNAAGSNGATNLMVNLFDGNSLLGTDVNVFCCVAFFHSPTSVYGDGATVDFTAIDSGTINGIMDMSFGTGSLTWPSAPTPTLLIGHATAKGYLGGEGTGIQINSVTILTAPIPEPSYIVLLLGGLVFLGLWHRRRVKPDER